MRIFDLFKRKRNAEKTEQLSTSSSEDDEVESPIIVLRLVDGVHLDVMIEWPKNGDITSFAQLLYLLNSGQIIDPQLAAATIYATHVGQLEKAAVIHKLLNSLAKKIKKEENMSEDTPLIPPSKVISHQIKINGQ